MPSLVGAICLMVALTMAVPVLAQQAPATKFDVAKLTRRSSPPPAIAPGHAEGYLNSCGRFFVCYTGIPLNCTPDTRPYENVAAHQCFCVHDGCPQ